MSEQLVIDVVRALCIATLTIAMAAIARAVHGARQAGVLNRGVWWLVAGGLSLSLGSVFTVVSNLHTDWVWTQTPFFFVGSVCMLIGSGQIVRLRRT